MTPAERSPRRFVIDNPTYKLPVGVTGRYEPGTFDMMMVADHDAYKARIQELLGQCREALECTEFGGRENATVLAAINAEIGEKQE